MIDITISARGIHPKAVKSLQDEYGNIFGMKGYVVSPSPKYNSSYIIRLENGMEIDLHDQWYDKNASNQSSGWISPKNASNKSGGSL